MGWPPFVLHSTCITLFCQCVTSQLASLRCARSNFRGICVAKMATLTQHSREPAFARKRGRVLSTAECEEETWMDVWHATFTSQGHLRPSATWGGHLLFCIRRASLCFASVLHLNLHHFVVPDRISEVFVLPKWLHSHNILESPHLQEKEGECFQQLNVKKKHIYIYIYTPNTLSDRLAIWWWILPWGVNNFSTVNTATLRGSLNNLNLIL